MAAESENPAPADPTPTCNNSSVPCDAEDLFTCPRCRALLRFDQIDTRCPECGYTLCPDC